MTPGSARWPQGAEVNKMVTSAPQCAKDVLATQLSSHQQFVTQQWSIIWCNTCNWTLCKGLEHKMKRSLTQASSKALTWPVTWRAQLTWGLKVVPGFKWSLAWATNSRSRGLKLRVFRCMEQTRKKSTPLTCVWCLKPGKQLYHTTSTVTNRDTELPEISSFCLTSAHSQTRLVHSKVSSEVPSDRRGGLMAVLPVLNPESHITK